MSEPYMKMMREHPVQKKWKPEFGDKFIHTKEYIKTPVMIVDKWFPMDFRNTGDYFMFGHTWLPRQEDWQDILDKKDVVCSESPHNFILENSQNVTEHLGYCSDMSQRIVISEVYTILWCLFVSREVYSIEWDWSKEGWVKA